MPTGRSCGSMAPRLSTISKRPSRAWAMYMFMRTWCWPGTDGRRAARPLGDRRVIERRDHVLLLERARLGHGGRPEPQARGTGLNSAPPPVNFASPG